MSMNKVPRAASLFLSLFTLSFIPSSSSSSSPLSFNLSPINIRHNNVIHVTGSAYISPNGLQVTPDEHNDTFYLTVGRATYHEPLHLWDNGSKNMVDFSTHFSFVIDSDGNDSYADGLAFFLAPVNSTVNEAYFGGGLGLWSYSANTLTEKFVAVEFDTYIGDIWDTVKYTHVGIDFNITGGTQNDAWITYDAILRNLTVTFTNNGLQLGSLSYSVDLRDRLPEYVIFGFSAATGIWFEKNSIKSWDFSSTEMREAPVPTSLPTTPSPQARDEGGNQNSKERKKKKQLVVGLSIGISILILVLAFGGYCLWKKCITEYGDESFIDPSLDKEFERVSGPKEFSYRVLAVATNNFAESEKLGQGGFGGVYKGLMRRTNTHIAVKKVSRESRQGLKEYESEVKIISQLKHRNLVQLLGVGILNWGEGVKVCIS